MRGMKLTAWRIPPIWNALRENESSVPEGSSVLQNQRRLMKSAEAVLHSIAADVRAGLLETVGVESRLSTNSGRCSMILELPKDIDSELIARAIDAENVEAWLDAERQVNLAVNPWYSTKDVDQTVLSAIKVIHVLLGMHATENDQPKTLKQKLLKSISTIMEIQQSVKK